MISLIASTRRSVDALAEEGRLPGEQAELLRGLLEKESQGGAAATARHGDQSIGQAVQSGGPRGGAVVMVGGGSGWTSLPEEVEELIFTALQIRQASDGDGISGGNHARLVCKDWKRWDPSLSHLLAAPSAI